MNAPSLNITPNTVNPKVAALANAMHLMRRHFGSTHTPDDFMDEAAAALADMPPFNPFAEPEFFDGPPEYDPRLEWAADYRASAL